MGNKKQLFIEKVVNNIKVIMINNTWIPEEEIEFDNSDTDFIGVEWSIDDDTNT